MKEVEIIKPDDWHVHFRDKEIMKAVVPETSRHFARAIVMPNLSPPILNGEDASKYRREIISAIPEKDSFTPFMTLYLTDNTVSERLENAFKNELVFAAKLYPAGATTNSDSGVTNIKKIMPVLETMSRIGMPLLIHGEVTNREIDIFDRERIFIENHLEFLCKELPDLRITLEHITTKDAVSYIIRGSQNLGASITPHHLALNRNSIFVNGIRPHNYCLPILKKEEHRKALIKAAISGNSKFFLGTDTAPHFKKDKESECGCAGIFNATYCMSILAQVFDDNSSILNLEKFVSLNGSNHYGLNPNYSKIRLVKNETPIKFINKIKVGNETIRIFNPEFPVYWEVEHI